MCDGDYYLSEHLSLKIQPPTAPHFVISAAPQSDINAEHARESDSARFPLFTWTLTAACPAPEADLDPAVVKRQCIHITHMFFFLP